MSINKLTNWIKSNIESKPNTPTTPPSHPTHPTPHHPQPNNSNPRPPHPHNAHRPNHKPPVRQAQPQPKREEDLFKGEKKMRIIPLGGLEEVGKNIMAIEYGNDIIIIDCGMSFAGPEMMGVDYIVPDVTYLAQRKHDIRGIIFTHGHLDHIGAIQYALPKLGNPPLFATKLTAGLINERLKEFGLDKTAKLHLFTEDSKLKLGAFEVEFFRVNHSIPEGMGVYIKSPAGSAVHTGDFKFDYQPAIDKPANLQRIAEFGRRGVDVLLIDSTNALKPGFCISEQKVADQIEAIIANTKGRLIISSFSSLIGRINQICNLGAKYNRKVFLSGRSMVNNMELAERLGYTTYPKGAVKKINPQVNSLPPSQVIIVTTGAQGETMSALTRISIGAHAQIKIREGDTVMISASPIPGNELAIVNVINNLYALGAKVITNGQMDIHTSGHAQQEELKLMYSLVNPRCYVPIHGEVFMRMGHAEMIKEIAPPSLHITILENGDVLEIGKQGVRKSKQKIPANDILVDGLGFGDIGSKVIQERKIMSQDGILMILFRAYTDTKRLVGEPDIISRGFVYVKESRAIAEETKQIAQKAFETITQQNRNIELKDLKEEISRHVNRFIRKRLGREPMIIPIVMYI
ncbi:ribonuclease J [Candidatus Peregrinibacteria bacterium CG_4_10_14_0_2_um_filter_43_11]|nr:MAG: ribonuclease J [Candidatus Peregrinibacteria bacterium CG_4_10_14_0_2_um_filter_43_11]